MSAPTTLVSASPASSRAPAAFGPASLIWIPHRFPWPPRLSTRRWCTCSIAVGASRRSRVLRVGDRCLRTLGKLLGVAHNAFELPYTPGFLHKKDGLVLSIGQFNQWVGSQLMSSGAVQIWPGMPVDEALIEDGKVLGVRLLDQGVDRQGKPEPGFTAGMDIRAALTVIGDGPVGAVSRDLDNRLGLLRATKSASGR